MGTKKLTELTLDIIILMSGVCLFISAQGIDAGYSLGQGSDFVPKLCTGLWIIFSVFLLIKETHNNFIICVYLFTHDFGIYNFIDYLSFCADDFVCAV